VSWWKGANFPCLEWVEIEVEFLMFVVSSWRIDRLCEHQIWFLSKSLRILECVWRFEVNEWNRVQFHAIIRTIRKYKTERNKTKLLGNEFWVKEKMRMREESYFFSVQSKTEGNFFLAKCIELWSQMVIDERDESIVHLRNESWMRVEPLSAIQNTFCDQYCTFSWVVDNWKEKRNEKCEKTKDKRTKHETKRLRKNKWMKWMIWTCCYLKCREFDEWAKCSLEKCLQW
jgi:hypothetical protein